VTPDRPFCLAWFQRQEPGGSRAVDPITANWLQRLAQGRHSCSVADGAAGIVSSEPLFDDGEFAAAAAGDLRSPGLLSAFARGDEREIARSPDAVAMLRLHRGGQSLGLLRDPLGQRPLFYQDNGRLLVACTDLDLLLRRPGWVRRLDRSAAGHYLAFGTPGLGRTLEAGTRSLPAAHILELEACSGPFVRRYWSPLSVPGWKVLDGDRERALREELDAAIGDAAAGADAALLLSGGIDSGYMAHSLRARGMADRVDAYTVRFTTPGAKNECDTAAETATSAGVRHHVVDMDSDDAAARLPTVLDSAQPRSAWSALTHAHLLDAIQADGRRVLLSGLGADEVFGGYSHYMKAYRRFRDLLQAYGEDGYERCLDDVLAQPEVAARTLFTGVPRFLGDDILRQATGPDLAGWSHVGETVRFYREGREIRPRAHLFELMVAHECQNRVPDLLLAGFCPDAEQRGVSARYPFLAPRLAGLACRLGATERFGLVEGVWKNKLALRRIAGTLLPPDVFGRPPMTFGAPFLAWLGNRRFSSGIQSIVEDDSGFPEDLIDRRWLSLLFQEVMRQNPTVSPCPEADQLWIVITLLGWYRKWIAQPEMEA
jgi:asparagine synthetase B (glutamine-hydrolysing)